MSIDPFADAVETAFRMQAVSTEYTPVGGSMIPLDVMQRSNSHENTDIMGYNIPSNATVINVLVSDAPALQRGDRIRMYETEYEVEDEPIKVKRNLVWRAGLNLV